MRSGRGDKERAGWRGKFQAPAKPAPMGYDELRKLYLARLRPVVAGETMGTMPAMPWFEFTWYEPDHRRDPDNVRAGGTKLILDALVLGGLLPDDKAADVDGFKGDSFVYAKQGEGVTVEASWDRDKTRWSMHVPFRLPDLNELIAAARQDGILTERTRQARRAR